jgi:outer membrane protein assembly factor BamE (lipoprotein component of BamABCDE complex)
MKRLLLSAPRSAALAVALAVLTACTTVGTQVEQADVERFQKGVATPTEVVAKLGTPQETGHKDNGDTTLSYVYMKGSPKAATFIPVVGLFAGGADVHSTRVTFEFDPSGHLLTVESAQGDTSGHIGF